MEKACKESCRVPNKSSASCARARGRETRAFAEKNNFELRAERSQICFYVCDVFPFILRGGLWPRFTHTGTTPHVQLPASRLATCVYEEIGHTLDNWVARQQERKVVHQR